MSQPAPKPEHEPTITPGEMRIELQLEGLRSVISGGNLAQAQAALRMEALLDKILAAVGKVTEAIETQTKLLTRANGHARHDAHPSE